MISALAASIASPAQGVWHVGPVPVRAYALCIIVGIADCSGAHHGRWKALGNRGDDVADIAMWAVPAGIIGGRLYHVLTDWQTYFGSNGRGVLSALRIWDGGLGIWGAIALGFVGAMYGCRRLGVDFVSFADAAAPGIVLAQATGRLGNWFNQELFGRPFIGPWALEIDPAHRPAGYAMFPTYHPTFLYELLACVAIALILVGAERRFGLANGRVFALYVALYCTARFGIESFRIDAAHSFLGLRLNEYTALIVGVGALVVFRRRGRVTC